MDFELSRDEFICLPVQKQNLAIYDNIITIKKDIKILKKNNSTTSNKFTLGYIWLFVITVYVGLKRFIPFF